MAKLLAVLAIALASIAYTAGPADAHSFGPQGPPHSHIGTCTPTNCYRWILNDGRIFQGDGYNYNGQLPWIGVLCSLRYTVNGINSWHVNYSPVGLWGTPGVDHPYCKWPTYGGVRWSLRP